MLEVKMQKELSETIGSAHRTSSIPSYSQFFETVVSAADDLHEALKLSEKFKNPITERIKIHENRQSPSI